MAETPPADPQDERPLGLAGYLEEDVEWRRLMGRVHRSIERRETSSQVVDLTMHGLTGVVMEYLKAIFDSWGRGRGGRRAD